MDERVTLAVASRRSAAQTRRTALRVARRDRGASPTAAIELADADRRRAAGGHHRPARRHQRRRRRAEGYRRRRRRDHAARAARARRSRRSLSEEAALPESSIADGAALRRDRSARRLVQHRQQHLGRHDLLDPPARHATSLSTFFEPGTRAAAPPASSSTARRPRWCWRSTARVDIFILDRRARRVRADPRAASRIAAGHAGIRDQRLEPPALGTARCAPISTIASPAPTGRAARTSTCAGSARWSPRRYRILIRGGVFLYPGDARPGYREGRLRLLYEAHPMALSWSRRAARPPTGAAASSNLGRDTLHQRVPLIIGSAHEVARRRALSTTASSRCSTTATRRCSRSAACSG